MVLFNYISNHLILNDVSYIIYTSVLVFLGFYGVIINKRNILVVLLFFELILLAINLNFLTFSVILDSVIGQIIGLYVLTAAGSEVSIGLAFVVLLFRIKGILNLNFYVTLKG